MWLFILGRAVQGLGGGLVIVALYVVVGRAYPERLRPAIMAAFAASWVVPSIVGPLASGTVTEHLGWRWVFVGIPVLVAPAAGGRAAAIRRRASGPAEGAVRRALRPAADPAGAGHLAGRRAAAVRGPGPAVAVGGPGRGGGVALLIPAVLGLLPRGTYRGGARAAVRRAAARDRRRVLHRGRVLRSADAGHPAGAVADAGRILTGGGRGAPGRSGSFVQSRARVEPYRDRLMMLGMVLTAAVHRRRAAAC